MTYFELVHNILKRECVTASFLLPFLSRILIEKPDFEPNPLFAITNIFMLNVIAEKIYEIDEALPHIVNEEFEDEEFEDDEFEDDEFEDDEFEDDEFEDDEFEDEDEEFDADNDFINDDEVISFKDDAEYITVSNLKDYKNYLLECCEIIISFKQNEVFRKSLREVKNCYKVGKIELNHNSRRITLEKWGNTYHLKKLRPSITCQSVKIELPDNLILIGDYENVDKYDSR